MTETASPIIATHALSKTYKNLTALKNLNLEVQRNSILGFLGPNGAGKTTTIKLLLGLIHPTSGSAAVFGMGGVLQSEDIRARVGYLPQEPHFYEYMSARQTCVLQRASSIPKWNPVPFPPGTSAVLGLESQPTDGLCSAKRSGYLLAG
jgi:ABC-type multidrug transport system ATPase subunit